MEETSSFPSVAHQWFHFLDRFEFVSGEDEESETWTTFQILQSRTQPIVTEVELTKERSLQQRRTRGSFVTLRSLGKGGNFAKDCKPTLMMERTRKLEKSSVKPWIE